MTRTFRLWSHRQVIPNFTISCVKDSIITLTIGLKLSIFKVLLDSFEEVYIDDTVEAVFFQEEGPDVSSQATSVIV